MYNYWCPGVLAQVAWIFYLCLWPLEPGNFGLRLWGRPGKMPHLVSHPLTWGCIIFASFLYILSTKLAILDDVCILTPLYAHAQHYIYLNYRQPFEIVPQPTLSSSYSRAYCHNTLTHAWMQVYVWLNSI